VTTSSDGILTATTDPTTASVKLAVDFTGYSGGVPAPTVNLIANPSSELSAALTGALLNVTLAKSATQKRSGSFSTRMTAVAAGAMQATGPNFSVSPGAAYTVSGYARAGTTGRTVTVGLAFYTAALGFISILGAGTVADTNAAFSRASSPVTAPANAYIAAVYVQVAGAALGEIHYIDDIQVEAGSTATAYADGSQPGSYWIGTPNASESARPAYSQLTVKRADGTIVRGLDAATAPGGILKGIDHEAPRGTAVSYTASLGNGYGTLASTAATATITDDGTAWLKCLGTPALSVQLSVHRYPDWERPQPMSALPILGGKYPIVSGDRRNARQGQLQLNTRARAAREALDALLESGGIGPYLLQPSVSADEPDCYVAAGTDTQARPYDFSAQQRRITSLPVQQVARPSTAGSRVAIPGKTYGDSTAALPLYSNRTGTYGART